MASGNLRADFYANIAAEAGPRADRRAVAYTDDPGVKAMLKFNLPRETYHQNMWRPQSRIQSDGLEGIVAPNDLFDEEYEEHASTLGTSRTAPTPVPRRSTAAR